MSQGEVVLKIITTMDLLIHGIEIHGYIIIYQIFSSKFSFENKKSRKCKLSSESVNSLDYIYSPSADLLLHVAKTESTRVC